jgi:hypothetical protein
MYEIYLPWQRMRYVSISPSICGVSEGLVICSECVVQGDVDDIEVSSVEEEMSEASVADNSDDADSSDQDEDEDEDDDEEEVSEITEDEEEEDVTLLTAERVAQEHLHR